MRPSQLAASLSFRDAIRCRLLAQNGHPTRSRSHMPSMAPLATIRSCALLSLISRRACDCRNGSIEFSIPATGSGPTAWAAQRTASFADRSDVPFDARMPELNRRRDPNASQGSLGWSTTGRCPRWRDRYEERQSGRLRSVVLALRLLSGIGSWRTTGTAATFQQAPGAPLRRS